MTASVGSLFGGPQANLLVSMNSVFSFLQSPICMPTKNKVLKLHLSIWLKRNKVIKITKAQMSDLQQQAEGHRFKTRVEWKPPEVFLVLGHWKFLSEFKKGFSRFSSLTKIWKTLFPRTSTNTKQGWMYIQRHTLYAQYTLNILRTDKDHGMQWCLRWQVKWRWLFFRESSWVYLGTPCFGLLLNSSGSVPGYTVNCCPLHLWGVSNRACHHDRVACTICTVIG